MKKYYLTGGIIGLIAGVFVSVYFASQIQCVGMYSNPDGTFGTTCAGISIVEVMRRDLFPEAITTLILVVIGVLLGLIIGKIVKKNRMVSQ